MATEVLRPNAGGDETELYYNAGQGEKAPNPIKNYTCVNEETPDDAATYVANSIDALKRDLYGLPTSLGVGTINFIKVYFRCAKDPTANGGLAIPLIKSNGTVTDGTEVLPDGTWTTYSEQWDTNPANEQPWEWADIDALQIGVSLFYGMKNKALCTQVYVEIDYTETPAYYHGLKVQGEGELALCDVDTNPLRIRKGGTTYGIELVATDDPNASNVRIGTGAGTKSIRKYT